jgi:hypothetical protein
LLQFVEPYNNSGLNENEAREERRTKLKEENCERKFQKSGG